MIASPALPGFDHHEVDVDGVILHLVEAGRGRPGPPLVLVHGWPQHWWIWRRILPRLAEQHHVIAVDLRGHGWSEAPPPGGEAYDKRVIAHELLALLERWDVRRPVLIGHDWGGWISLLAAATAPERIRGVVAVAIVAPWTKIPLRHLPRFAYQLVAGGPLGYLAHTAVAQRFLRLVFDLGAGRGRHLSDEEKETYLQRYREPARARAGVAMYRRFLTHELPAMLRGRYTARVPSEVPVLLLPGRGDGVLAPSLVARAAGPGIEVATIDGAGHWVPEQQPEAVIDHIERFLASLSSA